MPKNDIVAKPNSLFSNFLGWKCCGTLVPILRFVTRTCPVCAMTAKPADMFVVTRLNTAVHFPTPGSEGAADRAYVDMTSICLLYSSFIVFWIWHDLTKDMYMLNVLKKTEDSLAGCRKCRQCRAVDSDAMLGQLFTWFRHILIYISRHTAGFRKIIYYIYRSHCFIAWFVCFLHFFRLLLVKLAVNRKMMTRFASIKMENGQSQPRQGRLAKAARDMRWYER